jgi:hypothetical protein
MSRTMLSTHQISRMEANRQDTPPTTPAFALKHDRGGGKNDAQGAGNLRASGNRWRDPDPHRGHQPHHAEKGRSAAAKAARTSSPPRVIR